MGFERKQAADIDAGADLAGSLSRQLVEQCRLKNLVMPIDMAYLLAKQMRNYHAEMCANAADAEAKHYEKLKRLQNSDTPK